jgi:hypothetical protein
MAQVVGRRYSAVFGFESEADASTAATLIKVVLMVYHLLTGQRARA